MSKKHFLLTVLICGLMTLSFTGKRKPNLKSAMKALNGFCNYIPSGSTEVDNENTSIQAFYMSSTEITNFQYMEFLYDLKTKGELDKYSIAAVDSTGWTTSYKEGYFEPMAEYYHAHPAYQHYPVVNISSEAAELFCEWLTAKYDSLSNGELHIKFRVPTRAEWVYAASGGLDNSPYSWGGPYLRNAKGEQLANYLGISAEHITWDEVSRNYVIVRTNGTYAQSEALITAPAKSFAPNNYGLYNMNGNVSEMVSDGDLAVGGDWHSPGYDIRNESTKKFEKRHPTVGFRVVATHLEKTD